MVVYDAISIAEVTDKPTERETNLSLERRRRRTLVVKVGRIAFTYSTDD